MPGIDEARYKQLEWRASRRGFKEADIIIGRFAAERMRALPEDQLAAFEALLAEPDQDLYAWIMERAPTPAEHQGPVMDALRVFAQSGGAASHG